MKETAILQPAIALAALTFGVALIMFKRRVADMRRSGAAINQLPQTRENSSTAWTLRTNAAADNYANLFETPVIFYFLCLVFYVTQTSNPLIVTLAWVYVALRAAHSLIHISYNLISHRFFAYIISMIVLTALLIIAGSKVFS